jgi:hypothetical protein
LLLRELPLRQVVSWRGEGKMTPGDLTPGEMAWLWEFGDA